MRSRELVALKIIKIEPGTVCVCTAPYTRVCARIHMQVRIYIYVLMLS